MLARQCRAQFNGRNLTIRRNTTVHAVAWTKGIGDVEWPIPACRVGVTGWELDALHPSKEGVTCLRCLRSAAARRAAAPPVPQGRQLALDLIA